MAGMAVVSIPAIPEGWHGRDLVRVVDPLGCVAGWIAPALGGVLVGCHARLERADTWSPIALAHTGDAVYPFEPLVRREHGSPVPLRLLGEDWRLLVRDPTGAIVRGTVDGESVDIETQLEDAGVRISVRTEYEAEIEFAMPQAAWQSPAGSLGIEILEEECTGDRDLLTIVFREAPGTG